MSILSRESPAPAAAIVRAREEIAPLHERLWAAVGDTDLVEVVEQTALLRAELAAIEAAVLVELDHREVPRKRLHWASTSAWYAHTAGLTRGQATHALRHAHDLTTDRAATHDALRHGQISPAHAAVICRGIRNLPTDPDLRDRAETALLTQAAQLDAGDLSRAAARILDVVDPDHHDRDLEADLAREDRAAHDQRHLSITDNGAGGARLKGYGTVEDAAILRAALLPLTAPEPALDPDPGQSETGHEPVRDPRDHGARLWDALIRLAQHALDTHLPPDDHGTTARVSVTIGIDDLLTGLGHPVRSATTDDGTHLHPGVVRRLACDAEIIPIVLGTGSDVLDVGHRTRTATPPIWRALVIRDHGCAFPSCTRPPLMCHAHHITHWADGGPTTLANLVLLCGEHHRTLHHTPWQVRLNPHDHHPEFLPPPTHRDTSHEPTWIRHRQRHHPQRE